MPPLVPPPSALALPVLGSLQSALDQPLFPGKLLIWLLLMLSIVSWVAIISKALSLFRSKRADHRFLARLRQSRQTMEVYEEGLEDEHSPHFGIYFAGAREAAFQLLGSKDRLEGMEQQMRSAAPLSIVQVECLRRAFQSACRKGLGQLHSGIAVLRLLAAAALLFGGIGTAWTMMSGFDRMEGSDGLAEATGSGLGFLVISLFVATPAILARLAFIVYLESRDEELIKFKDDVTRLFERKFGGLADRPPRKARSQSLGEDPVASGTETDSCETPHPRNEGGSKSLRETISGKVYRSETKQYRSIRDQLLSSPEDEPDGELEINPIARQAADRLTRQRQEPVERT